MTRQRLTIALASLGMLLISSAVVAQKPRVDRGNEAWPEMGEVFFLVQDKGEEWDPEAVPRGGTVRIKVGQTVILRMQAVPAAGQRKARYPSARFTLLTGKARVTLSKADEQVGRVLVTGNRVDDRSGKETWIRYELLRPVSPDRLMQGNIQIVVGADQPVQEAPTEKRGVTLYRDSDLRGYAQVFYSDVPDLRSTAFGQDTLSSLAIDEGCRVYLYDDVNYGGRYVIVDRTAPRLDAFGVRNDSVSSLQLVCD